MVITSFINMKHHVCGVDYVPNLTTAQSLRVMSCLEQPCSDDWKVHLGVARHDKVDDVAPPYVEAAVEDPRHLSGSRFNLTRAKIVGYLSLI